MKKFCLAGVMAGFFLSLLLTGCGDTYRPVITPFPTHGTDPKNTSLVTVVNEGVIKSTGAPCTPTDDCAGSTTDIDVPGDIVLGNNVVGDGPNSAVLINSGLYISNRNSNNLSLYSPSLSGLSTNNAPTTTSLNSTASVTINAGPSAIDIRPSFVTTTQGTSVFVAMAACAVPPPTVPPTPKCTAFDPNTPGVLAIVSTTSNQLVQTLQMDLKPVAMVELADTTKLYVVNQGNGVDNGTVTVVNAINNTILSPTSAGTTAPLHGIPVGVSPIWATATPDSQFVFVLNNGSDSVSVISAANDSATLMTVGVGSQSPRVLDRPLQTPMVYDSQKQRLYVTNPGDDTVSVFDTSKLTAASPTMPSLGTVHVPDSSVPTSTGARPFSITVLPDGSRAYVLNAGNGGTVVPSVSVIDANSFAASQIQTFFGNDTDPRGILASSDGSKVYVALHGSTVLSNATLQPGTAVIKTLDNSVLKDALGTPFPMPAPFQDPLNCTTDSVSCPRQKPVLLVAQ
jgi:DNA-binding beta-propeller fold protein YncE